MTPPATASCIVARRLPWMGCKLYNVGQHGAECEKRWRKMMIQAELQKLRQASGRQSDLALVVPASVAAVDAETKYISLSPEDAFADFDHAPLRACT